MQVSEFFMPYLYITQGENVGSHEGTYNIDYSGRNEMGKLYKAPIYAPFDFKVVYAENSYGSGNMRIIQSINKVKTPIGDTYVTMAWGHDANPILKKNQTGKKGDLIGHTGAYGYATGDHVHVACAKGAWKGFDNSGKHQQLKNAEHQYNLFYVNNVEVQAGGGYSWKKYEEPTPTQNNYVCLGNMYVRYGAGLNYGIKRVKELTEDGRNHCTCPDRPYADAVYKEGTVWTLKELVNNKYGTWGRSPSGWICIKGASGREYCKKA